MGAKSTDYQNLESAQEFSDKCVDAAENGHLLQSVCGVSGVPAVIIATINKTETKHK